MTGSESGQSRTKAANRKRLGCRTYLMLLLVVACLVLVAIVYSSARWQAVVRDSGISAIDADPGLNLAQRLYLQNYLANNGNELRQPAGDDREILFEIAAGATADIVIEDLANAGLLNKPDLFLNYLRYYGLDSGLQTGQFTLNGRLPQPSVKGPRAI
jgi:hypothetical protein